MACNTTGLPRRTGTGAHSQPEPHPSQACYYYAMQAWCFVMSDVTEAATSKHVRPVVEHGSVAEHAEVSSCSLASLRMPRYVLSTCTQPLAVSLGMLTCGCGCARDQSDCDVTPRGTGADRQLDHTTFSLYSSHLFPSRNHSRASVSSLQI